MDTLDIILINTISYMSGIFTGLVISYKLRSNKNCNREKDNNKDNKEETRIIEREYHETDTNKYRSPLQTALTYPSAPPPPLSLNPEYTNEKQKKITITTE
jgi:hypothetical protein